MSDATLESGPAGPEDPAPGLRQARPLRASPVWAGFALGGEGEDEDDEDLDEDEDVDLDEEEEEDEA